jgi:hypothetical protein
MGLLGCFVWVWLCNMWELTLPACRFSPVTSIDYLTDAVTACALRLEGGMSTGRRHYLESKS